MTQKRGLPLSRLLSTGMLMWTDPKHKPSLSLLPAWITNYAYLFMWRYFSSVPAPTKPALLPRPKLKGDSGNDKIPDLNLQGGPVVLSPPRKLRRVSAPDGTESNIHRAEKAEEIPPTGLRRHTDENMSSQSSRIPMSVDVGVVFGTRPAPRPTLNR
jgi:cyclin-dependent kinase 7